MPIFRHAPRPFLTRLVLTLTTCLLLLPQAWSQSYREVQWDDLIPKHWNPSAAFKGVDLGRLQDSDPKAQALLENLRREWDQAPTESTLNGAQIRLAGFVIPLERKGKLVSEFLLLPYFGACIHTPPPPANQIIHVTLKKALSDIQTMDAFWVHGTLSVARGDSGMGVFGYRMSADKLEVYPLRGRK